MFVINPYRFATTSSALTSADFTTSNGDGGTVTWTWTQVVITDPNTSKSVFTKCNNTYNSNIIYAQANMTWTANAAAGNLWGIYISSTNFVTSSQLHTQNYHALAGSRGTASANIRLRINTTSNVYNLDNAWQNVPQDVKITYNTSTNDIKYWYWNGSAWSQLWTTQTYDILQGSTIKLYLTNVDVWDTNTYTYNNIYFWSAASDYSTHYP